MNVVKICFNTYIFLFLKRISFATMNGKCSCQIWLRKKQSSINFFGLISWLRLELYILDYEGWNEIQFNSGAKLSNTSFVIWQQYDSHISLHKRITDIQFYNSYSFPFHRIIKQIWWNKILSSSWPENMSLVELVVQLNLAAIQWLHWPCIALESWAQWSLQSC